MDKYIREYQKNVNENVYIEVSQYLNADVSLVCKLKKAIYGLKKAPVICNRTIKEVLVKLDFTRSENDFRLYTYRKGYECYFVLYVHNILIAGTSGILIKKVVDMLSNKFGLCDIDIIKKFLHMDIEYSAPGGIAFIDQKEIIETVANRLQVRKYTADITILKKY